jgi:hypothetical protein
MMAVERGRGDRHVDLGAVEADDDRRAVPELRVTRLDAISPPYRRGPPSRERWAPLDPRPVPVVGGTPVTFASQSANAIVLDGTSIYWTATNTVLKCPLAGCDASGPVAIATGQGNALNIALDAASVYWTDQGNGTVMKGPK